MELLGRIQSIDPSNSIFVALHFNTAKSATNWHIITFYPHQPIQPPVTTTYFLLKGVCNDTSSEARFSGPVILPNNLLVVAETECSLLELTIRQSVQYLKELSLFRSCCLGIIERVFNTKFNSEADPKAIQLVIFYQNQYICTKKLQQQYCYLLLEGKVVILKQYACKETCHLFQLKINADEQDYLLGEEALYHKPYYHNIKCRSYAATCLKIQCSELSKLITPTQMSRMKYQHKKRIQQLQVFQTKLLGVRLSFNNSYQKSNRQDNLCNDELDKGNKIKQKINFLNTIDHLSKRSQNIGNGFFEQNKNKLKFELINKGLKTVERENYLENYHVSKKEALRLRILNARDHNSYSEDYLIPIRNKLRIMKTRKL